MHTFGASNMSADDGTGRVTNESLVTSTFAYGPPVDVLATFWLRSFIGPESRAKFILVNHTSKKIQHGILFYRLIEEV